MNIDQEKMIVEALPSLYPLHKYEEDAIRVVLDAIPHWIPVDLENNEPPLEEWVLVSGDGYVMQDCIVERGGEKIWYHGGNIQPDDRYMPLPEPYKGDTE